jgi:hypothetical protein
MKFLGISAIALCFISASLCAAARLYGRAQPPPAAVQSFSFDQCGDAICFKGIIPGLTSADETLGLLSKFTGSAVDQLPVGVPIGADGQASVFVKILVARPTASEYSNVLPIAQPMRVGPILLTRRNGKVLFPVGWVVAQYGAPCRITVNPTGYDFVLRYPTLIVQVRLPLYSERRLSVGSPTTSLMLNEDAHSEQCADADPAWVGFASVERYLTNE